MRLSKANFYTRSATYGLTLLAVAGSLLPSRHIEQLTFSLSDKLIHAICYFMLAVGWLHTFSRGNQRKQLFVVFALLVMGFLLECLQALLPINRVMDVYDLVANAVGVALGLLVARLWAKVL